MSILIETVTTVAQTAGHVIDTLPAFIDDPAPKAPPGVAEKTGTVLGAVKWLCLVVVVIGTMIFGATWWMAHKRGEGIKDLGVLGAILGGTVVIVGAVGIISWIADA